MDRENQIKLPAGARADEERSWRPLPETQLVRDADAVFNAYTAAFQKRFNIKPNINLPTDTPVIKDLTRTHGRKSAIEIVETFVRIDGTDGYFYKRGHIIPLLRDNVNIVLVEVGKMRRRLENNSGLRIATDLACDPCGEYFRWEGAPENLGARRICPVCRAKGKT